MDTEDNNGRSTACGIRLTLRIKVEQGRLPRARIHPLRVKAQEQWQCLPRMRDYPPPNRATGAGVYPARIPNKNYTKACNLSLPRMRIHLHYCQISVKCLSTRMRGDPPQKTINFILTLVYPHARDPPQYGAGCARDHQSAPHARDPPICGRLHCSAGSAHARDHPVDNRLHP